jgi:hypothetical protein
LLISAENGPASGAQIEMSSSSLVVGVGDGVGVLVAVGCLVAVGVGAVVGCSVGVKVAVGCDGLVGVGEADPPPPPSSSPHPTAESNDKPRTAEISDRIDVFMGSPPCW